MCSEIFLTVTLYFLGISIAEDTCVCTICSVLHKWEKKTDMCQTEYLNHHRYERANMVPKYKIFVTVTA